MSLIPDVDSAKARAFDPISGVQYPLKTDPISGALVRIPDPAPAPVSDKA